jgi:type VI secretion system protein ImpL
MARLWAAAYDPALQRDLIAGFAGHLDALLAGLDSGRIGARSVNEAQVAAARVKARDVSPGARAFALLAAQGPARALRPWTPLDPEAGGRAAAQALLRASGAELGAPIPGLFTREGFHAVFLPNADAAVAAALSESWVLNE